MIFVFAGFLFLLGVVLLAFGLRGYEIDDHPLCRKCGFDLTGRPETSTRCPECGADLSQTKSIHIGHRRRKRGLAGVGAALMLLTLAFAGVATWSAVQGFDWEQVKPTWYVIHEASDRTGGVQMIAWTELQRRLTAGTLSKTQSAKITDLALTIQGDPTRVWNPVYGGVIEFAHAGGVLSAAQWQLYARQAPALSLALRAQVRRGDDIPASIMNTANRVGPKPGLYMRIFSPHGVGDLSDPPNYGDGYTSGMIQNGGTGSSNTALRLNHNAATTAPLGTRKMEVWSTIEIRDGGGENAPVVAKWKQTFSGTWSLVAADAPTVAMINDPSYRANVEGAISVSQFDVSAKSSFANLTVNFKKLAVPLAYDIFVRIGGGEQMLASIAVAAGDSGYGTGGQPKLNGATKVDLIFRPNPAAARNTTTMTKMWNGEITLKNVPVTYRP